MLSPQQQDECLATSATKGLSTLLDAHACNICHDLLSAPVALPCCHVFCSECVRRHLSSKSLCPYPTCRKPTTYMQLTPLRGYDVALEPLRRTGQKVELAKRSDQKRLVFLSPKACSRAQIVERLRAHDIPTHGGAGTIANRYNEFVVRWNANLDAGVPKSEKSIVAAVMAAERAADKKSRRAKRASSFFMRAPSPKNEADAEAPAEGDDFATLVMKTKAREERKRKLARLVKTNEKRVCVTNVEHSLKECTDLQNKAPNEVDNGSDAVSGLYLSGALSQSELTQGNHEPFSTIAPLDQSASIPQKNIVPAQRLSIDHNVCGLTIQIDETGNNDGSNVLHRSVEVAQSAGHCAAHAPSPRAMLSQTTPEKQVAPVAEGIEVADAISELQNSEKIPMNPPSGSDPLSKASALWTNPPHNPKTEPATMPSHPSLGVFRRRRTPVSSMAPSPYERNLNNIPQSITSQQYRSDAKQNLAQVSHGSPSEGTDVRHVQSSEDQPTRAQLERAERNRRAAIAKRLRYYKRQHELSQMRQPEL